MLSIEEKQKVDNAVENITDILTQDGMRFEMAKKVFDRIQVLFMSSKNCRGQIFEAGICARDIIRVLEKYDATLENMDEVFQTVQQEMRHIPIHAKN